MPEVVCHALSLRAELNSAALRHNAASLVFCGVSSLNVASRRAFCDVASSRAFSWFPLRVSYCVESGLFHTCRAVRLGVALRLCDAALLTLFCT